MPRRVAASALAVALAVAVQLSLAPSPIAHSAPAQNTPTQATEVGIQIELVEEQYAFEPDASLHLVYRLTGDLASLDLGVEVPATTVPTVPVPTETAPVDTTPIDTATTDTVAPETVAPETTVPPTTVAPAPLFPLRLQVTNYPPLTATTSTRELDRIIGGDADRAAFGSAIDGIQIDDARPLVTYDDDGAAILTVDVPTDVVNSVEERLKFETPGLYPVRTELLVGIGNGDIRVATHGTVVQRLPGPNESAPVPIDLSIVTAVKPAADGDTPAAAEFDDAVAFAGAVTAPVTLDVPPPIVAAAASTPAGSQSLAGALVGDEFVAVPAVPFDVSSAVEVDRGDEFARLLSAGEDMLTAAVPTTPSRRNAWVVLDPLSGAGAQELRDLGYRYLVMTQDMYRATVDTDPQVPGSQDTGLPPTDLFTTVSLPDGGTLPLIVVDSLSADLTVASADEILASSTPAEWAVGAVTSMLVDDLEQPALEHSRVLSTPDLAAPDARLVTGLEALAATTPSVEFVEASTLTGTTDFQTARGEPVVVTLPDTAGPSLAARVELLNATALSAASAGSMLPPDDPRPDRWATTLNAMLSTAIDDDQAAVVAGQVQAEADALRDAVVPPAPFKFTLTGRSGDIEVQVGNTSDEPLDVVLRFSSPKLSFPESTPPPGDPEATDVGDVSVTLRPNDETSFVIPVRAKSNGTSPITVEVLTPAGESIADPVTITSRVSAFTGLGQVLTAGFLLVLLSWWFAHWRSRRRADIEGGRDRHPSGAV